MKRGKAKILFCSWSFSSCRRLGITDDVVTDADETNNYADDGFCDANNKRAIEKSSVVACQINERKRSLVDIAGDRTSLKLQMMQTAASLRATCAHSNRMHWPLLACWPGKNHKQIENVMRKKNNNNERCASHLTDFVNDFVSSDVRHKIQPNVCGLNGLMNTEKLTTSKYLLFISIRFFRLRWSAEINRTNENEFSPVARMRQLKSSNNNKTTIQFPILWK